MIKHRFILPSSDDFKIFAAIPCENTVLTWEPWLRPPDEPALTEGATQICSRLSECAELLLAVSSGFAGFAATSLDSVQRGSQDTDAVVRAVHEAVDAFKAEHKREEERAEVISNHYLEAAIAVRHTLLPTAQETPFHERVVTLIDFVNRTEQLHEPGNSRLLERVRTFMNDVAAERQRIHALSDNARWGAATMTRTYRTILDAIQAALKARRALLDTAGRIALLLSSDPLPTTPCPPGVPFAAYTIEWSNTVVNVVEGKAWLHEEPRMTEAAVKQEIAKVLDKLPKEEQRQIVQDVKDNLPNMPPPPPPRTITDEEKRVVEIVTQMLTERSLNPKADTRVPIREVDPKHAHQQREAERRDPAPRVRTIKFHVTPPRYLREAAERILSSPRRAHWVIGHWRNQFYGEKRAQHRQTWIKPHIRGLGEASATVAAVVAPRKSAETPAT